MATRRVCIGYICEFTDEQIIAEMNKRFEKVVITKKQTFYIQDDCWNIVKEFAGIYNITTKWDKLEKLGVDKVHDIYKQYAKRRIVNYKKFPAKVKELVYKKLFTQYKSFKLMTDLNDLINPKKEDKSFDFNVGDEVMYYNGAGWNGCSRLGRVIKINKSSITWAEFEVSHSVSDNPDGCRFQTFEQKKHYYDKTKTMKPKCIRANISIPDLDRCEYYTTNHDWGR